MAQLSSPGVSVSVINESYYIPPAPGTVPLVIVATEENKLNGSGTGIAPGTMAVNTGQIYTLTSQKDLSDYFGIPTFKVDANQNPIHGSELNEYGLQATYSLLGVSNRAFVVRANINLGQLEGTATAPTSNPANGDLWFDTATSQFGVFEWNASSALLNGQSFEIKYPTIITESDKVDVNYAPLSSIGMIGDYALVCVTTLNKLWYKKALTATAVAWVAVGSEEWVSSRPTVVGDDTAPVGTIDLTGCTLNTVSVSGYTTVASLISAINNASPLVSGITAAIVNNKLELYSTGVTITLSGAYWNTATKIPAGVYNAPLLTISKHTEVPQWKSISSTPRPTGSIWIKTTNPNLGANWVIKQFNSSTNAWSTQYAPLYSSGRAAMYGLDPVNGGLSIGIDSLYVKYNDDEIDPNEADFKIYTRRSTGSTTIRSIVISTAFRDKTIGFSIYESIKNSSSWSSVAQITNYVVDHDASADNIANQLATKINDLALTYVKASVDSLNRVVISHLLGGEIKFISNALSTESVSTIFPVTVTNNLYDYIPQSNINVTSVTSSVSPGSEKTLTTTTSDAAGIYVGMTVSGANIAQGTTVTDISYSAPTYVITISQNALTGGSFTATFGGVSHIATLWTSVDDTGNGFIPASSTAPTTLATNDTLWYNDVVDEIDIMVHDGSKWIGYRNGVFDGSGIAGKTDINGPIISATQPTSQSDINPITSSTALVTGDLWISTSDIENYPLIYRYNGELSTWELLDNSDQTSEYGILFSDARWTDNGSQSLSYDGSPSSIVELLSSNYVDFDAPDPALYPQGMLLWNLRRSGFNVKRFVRDYVDVNGTNERMSNEAQTDYYPHRWVSYSPNQADGSGSFGRKAQRSVVVQALQSTVNSNQFIRDEESKVFNLIVCPGYPELISEMINLNYDRGLTAFVIGDSPARLLPDTASLSNWGNNVGGSLDNDDAGLVSYDEYTGVFYPWGYTSDNLGNNIVVPPSHMVLRTIALSDQVSYPWFAPAGIRRGGITNASSVGYITSEGEFQSISFNTGQRDTLRSIKVNPITFIDGSGYVLFDQITRARLASALDHINVARLIIFLRRQLAIAAKPFLFEPNDKITRDEFKGVIDSLLLELVGQRALYDFITVCDKTNNTPERIDRNELYADLAIACVKSVDMIYIPIRIKNTGEIGNVA